MSASSFRERSTLRFGMLGRRVVALCFLGLAAFQYVPLTMCVMSNRKSSLSSSGCGGAGGGGGSSSSSSSWFRSWNSSSSSEDEEEES